jgi:hypothetical protein
MHTPAPYQPTHKIRIGNRRLRSLTGTTPPSTSCAASCSPQGRKSSTLGTTARPWNRRYGHSGRCPGHCHHLLSRGARGVFQIHVMTCCRSEGAVAISRYLVEEGGPFCLPKSRNCTPMASPASTPPTMAGRWACKA